MTTQPERNQLAFRGIASLAIVVGHLLFIPHYNLGFAGYADWGYAAKLIFFRFIAVDGFFMLSGCVLCLHYWEHFTRATPAKAFDRFYLKRLARVYPMHLVGMAMVGIYTLAGVAHPIASGLQDGIFRHWEWTGLLNLLLMQGWGIVPVAAWNEPSWTLSVLFMLYLLFPNLVLGLKRLPQTPSVYLLLFAALLGGYTALRLGVGLGSASDGAGALVRGVAMFGVGVAIARLHMLYMPVMSRLRGNDSGRGWDRVAAIACLALLGLMVAWWEIGQFDLWPMHLVLAVLVLCTLRAEGRFSRAVANRVTMWLGTISFSVYILHYPIMMGLKQVAGGALAMVAAQGPVGLVAAYAISIAAVLGLAHLGWRYVEVPLGRVVGRG